jgi:pimeloyl-ACP methyl ester carboxylesterase
MLPNAMGVSVAQRGRSGTRRFAAAEALGRGRSIGIRAKDGIRLHAEVFGPEDGYPVVLAHGITCALRVWAYQIADLAKDHRVIAFDHRGHGRSAVPARRSGYSLDCLAGDVDAVLEATLKPGERAVIAGHSMGGIAISSWAERYPERVPERVDAVALINTTTGDLLRHVQFLPVPPQLAAARVRAAGTLLKTFGATPLLRAADIPGRRFLSALAVGRDADPAIAEFVFELFNGTSPAGRGGWARALVDSVGTHQHIGLTNLSVPTLVIGSEKDRLLPMVSARRIAKEVPNLAQFVELSGGHCAILERPEAVNKHLRWLIDSATEERRVSS